MIIIQILAVMRRRETYQPRWKMGAISALYLVGI